MKETQQAPHTPSTLHRYLFTVTTFSRILALSMFIIFPIIAFYLGIKYQQKITINNSISKTSQSSNIPSNFQQNDKDFVEKHFTNNKTIFGYEKDKSFNPTYSSLDFLNIDSKQIEATRCSVFYEDEIYGTADPYFYLKTSNDAGAPIIEPNIRAWIIEPQKKDAGKGVVGDVLFCQTKDNKVIASFAKNGKVFWGIWNGNDYPPSNLKVVANLTIPTENSYLFRCRTPLLLTNSNIFYLACDSLNGPSLTKIKFFSFIYSVDLNSGDVKLKYQCEADRIPNSNSSINSTISCK